MNNPIISPWFFYFTDLADAIHPPFLVIGVFSFLILIVAAVIHSVANKDEVDVDKIKKLMILLTVICLFTLLTGIFIPTKDTMYKMAAAKYATPTNINKIIEKGEDFGKDIKDIKNDIKADIIDIIRELKVHE